jgi:hypothetical protein
MEKAKRARKAETPKQPSLYLMLRAPYLYPDHDKDGVHLMMDVKKEEFANAPSFTSKRDQEAEKQAAERARSRPEIPRVPQPGNPAQRPGTN